VTVASPTEPLVLADPNEGSAVPRSRLQSVTVIVPTRSGGESLRQAVRSVIGQRYPGLIECVVVEDGRLPPGAGWSDAVPLVDGRRGRRAVRTIRNDRTPGPAGARNAGAMRATTELLAFCDDDDRWHPDKLRLQVDALEAFPDASACAAGIVLRTGWRPVVKLPPERLIGPKHLLHSRVAALHTSTLVVRRDTYVDRVGPMDEAAPGGFGDDYDWLLRAARVGPILVVRSPLVRVRTDRSSFEGRWALRLDGIRYLIERHPEVIADPHNRGRLYGRMAFASAALGRRREAWGLARAAWSADHGQVRAYLSMLVLSGVASPDAIASMARRLGRGV
jgi:glycosyltransferase involved in cell wall biosynthesis